MAKLKLKCPIVPGPLPLLAFALLTVAKPSLEQLQAANWQHGDPVFKDLDPGTYYIYVRFQDDDLMNYLSRKVVLRDKTCQIAISGFKDVTPKCRIAVSGYKLLPSTAGFRFTAVLGYNS